MTSSLIGLHFKSETIGSALILTAMASLALVGQYSFTIRGEIGAKFRYNINIRIYRTMEYMFSANKFWDKEI